VKKKTVQEKKRFDRGTKYSTVAKTGAAPPAKTVSAVTTSSTTTATTAAAKTKSGTPKPAKVKKEKVRYGQAPRKSLPAGPEETATGSDVGEGAASAVGAAGSTAVADVGPSPLDVQPAPTGKTRYSDRAKQVAAQKKVAKVKKVNEKVAAGPVAATPEEKATEKAQAAPLGLNGDTSKNKKAKQPKNKNAPKERLQNQPPKPAAPAPEETPSKAPDRGTAQEGILPPQKPADSTTLPPSTTSPDQSAPKTPPTTPQ
jgi:peptidyl-prolyl cis-trans isomerase SurA